MKQNITLVLAALALIGVGYVIYDKTMGSKDHDHAAEEAQLNMDPMANPEAAVEEGPALPATTMTFAKMEHDYGDIKQNTENEYIFSFTNTGAEPLVISNAVGSCGCTVPEYPKEPVAPGAKGEIKVVFSPGMKEGAQSKNVTITANTEPKQTKLTIKANVLTEAK